MTDQTDDFRFEPDADRAETAQDDVEAHHKIRGATDEGDEARMQTDDGDDDVEGHMKLRHEPGLGG